MDFCRTSDKVEFGWTPTEVGIKIKKFRERQSNLKSKLISKQFQPNSNLTLEEKREEEKRVHTPLPPKVDNGFDAFWKAYPRKDSKQTAKKSWGKINMTPDLLDTILKAVCQHSMKPDWLKNDGQYIPMPATWINNKRWEDEGSGVSKKDPNAPLDIHEFLAAQDHM